MLHRFSVSCLALSLLFGIAAAADAQSLKPVDLRCEYLKNPLGVPQKPRLSWKLQAADADAKNLKQTAYQIILTDKSREITITAANEKQPSDLQSCTLDIPPGAWTWEVTVWDQDGKPATSKPAEFVRLPDSSENSSDAFPPAAKWISGADSDTAPWLRKTMDIAEVPPLAVIYVASFGYHEVYVNGQKVDDSVLAPAVSNLQMRVMSVPYDITKLLKPGKNTVGIWLGHGWAGWDQWINVRKEGEHIGRLPHGPAVKAYIGVLTGGSSFKPLAETGTDWKFAPSCYSKTGKFGVFNFGGEIYDARKNNPDWSSPSFDDSGWQAAVEVKNVAPETAISPQLVEKNRTVSEFPAVKIEKTGDKQYRVDMGKVYNGWLQIPFTGKAGDIITLKFTDRDLPDGGEKEGILAYGQEDRIILSGDPAKDIFQNKFNYRTFRWVTIEGTDTLPPPEKFTGKLIRTGYEADTTFECSEEMLNKIYKMLLHSYECLTLGGYIVDCSHRERLGYGAEGQASMECGMMNFDQAALYRHWAGSWRDVQMKDGRMPNTAPQTWGGGGPAWRIIGITLPWEHYRHYGDERVLAENYGMIKKHLSMLEDRIVKEPDHIIPVFTHDKYHYIGDWYSSLDIDPPQGGRPIPHLLRQVFTNCYTIYGFQKGAAVAGSLGETEDAKKFRQVAEDLQKATHKAFYNAGKGEYGGFKEQTYLSVPLLTGVVPGDLTKTVQDALIENITVTQTGHLTTGVLGSYLQEKYLNQIGRDDLIAEWMKQKKDKPSFGFFLENGLTTVPEAMNIYGSGSRCHTSFLSYGAWFINAFAGIQPDAEQPGFKHFFVKPGAVKSAGWVKASHQTPYGKIDVAWKNADGKFRLDVSVPPNTTATVCLPDGRKEEIGSGRYHFEVLSEDIH
ncbi:MAG: glycoside hydrolase family 78 protein [Planctomycetaceae bacterium]|jgi:alpha-L-rhamnosidase|nr:glycoside hydrolase family 78 protein [Planctomycetaceae bacterium]